MLTPARIGAAKIPPKLCCCTEPGCPIGDDDYNRAPANPPTGNWKVISGEWEIVENELQHVTPGIILTTLRQGPSIDPTRRRAYYVVVDLIDCPEKEWEVVIHYQTTSVYNSVRFTEDGSGHIYPEFLINGSVVMDKNTHPLTGHWALSGGKLRVSICYSLAEWTVQAELAEPEWTLCGAYGADALPADATVGLVGYRSGDFDNWVFSKHWESDPACAKCACFCFMSDEDYSCLPETLCLTMVPRDTYCWEIMGVEDCCPTATNIEMTLLQQTPETSGATPAFGNDRKVAKKFTWWGPRLSPQDGSDMDTTDVWFKLICSNGEQYLAAVQYPDETAATIGNFVTPDTILSHTNARLRDPSSTCDPLNLVFPNFRFPRSAPGQCYVWGVTYDIYVTVCV